MGTMMVITKWGRADSMPTCSHIQNRQNQLQYNTTDWYSAWGPRVYVWHCSFSLITFYPCVMEVMSLPSGRSVALLVIGLCAGLHKISGGFQQNLVWGCGVDWRIAHCILVQILVEWISVSTLKDSIFWHFWSIISEKCNKHLNACMRWVPVTVHSA